MESSGLRKAIFLGLLLFISPASGWICGDQAKIKIENGVTVVYNPKKPVPLPGVLTELFIKEDLSLGQRGASEDSMLLDPRDVDLDETGNIYILDRKAVHIKVFDRQGNFVRVIGKKGQGPGEFQNLSAFQVTPQQQIIVCDTRSRRVLLFKLDGQFLRELSAGKMWMFNQAKADSKGNIVGSHTVMDREPKTELVRFNANLEPIFTIASVPIARYPVFNPYFPLLYFEVTAEGNVLWGITTEYEFRIVDPDGKIIKKILKDYDPEKLTQEDRDKRAKEIWGDQGSPSDVRAEWPANFPAFQDFIMDDRGWLFVRPYSKTKEEKGAFYDIFDTEGRYIARVLLPARIRLIKDGKVYTIEEDLDGLPSVKRYSFEWK
jgi:hypothetical protein